jgi:diadenosine tetraphosphate (Ap4A) HIT family hydrolase
VPKDYFLCIGALPPLLTSELIGFLADVVSFVRAEYGPVAIFEHGPVQRGTTVGCGVDHAHVHVVPVKPDWSLLQAARTMAPEIVWEKLPSLHETRKYFIQSRPYLLLHEPVAAELVIGTGPSIPSQMFRRIIANYVGRPHDFDWKQHPELEKIQGTIERLRKSAELTIGAY